MQHSTRRNWLIFLLISLALITLSNGGRLNRGPSRLTARPTCPQPSAIPNGSFRMRRNNQLMRVSCLPGYQLHGDRIIDCVNGKWVGQKPVCAKAGCSTTEVPEPEHGLIQFESTYRMMLFCLDNYNLAGNRYAYCNGTNWDRPIGNCREPNYHVEHECDFETDDICGWVHEESIGTQWRRVTAMNIYTSYHTGPRHDHTFASLDGGHYMLMETVDPTSQPAYLQSPIYERDLSLKTACCFRFYYFMYGAGVGDLSVYVRPVSVKISALFSQRDKYEKFHKSGNQNNIWNEAHFSISELKEDFQIVIVATAGRNHLSDIAIDDVKLMTGEECTALDEDNSASAEEEVTEETIFDTQSCDGRCFQSLGSGFLRRDGKLFGQCNCDFLCEYDDSCCPDFRAKCLNSIFMQTTSQSDETSNSFEVASTEFIKSTTPAQITTQATTTTTRKTTPKPTLKTTKLTTPTTTTTTSTTTTTTTTTTPKPLTTPKTTRATSTTTTRATTTTTTTTPKPKILATSMTAKPTEITSTRPTPKPLPTKNNYVNGTDHPTKESIAIWKNGSTTSHKQILPNTGRILLIGFIIIIIGILLGSVIYRHKAHLTKWWRVNSNGGDVETTSIRGKYRFNPKYAQKRDDTDNLLADDLDAENESNFGIDNNLKIGKPVKANNATSLSTNL